jgi:hypothetical protein
MNISKIKLNIVLNVICIHIDWWELVAVINVTVKRTLKSTSACAISETFSYFEWVTCQRIENNEICYVCQRVYFHGCIYGMNMQK